MSAASRLHRSASSHHAHRDTQPRTAPLDSTTHYSETQKLEDSATYSATLPGMPAIRYRTQHTPQRFKLVLDKCRRLGHVSKPSIQLGRLSQQTV